MADSTESQTPVRLELATTTPSGPLFRVARAPNPWAWPDWANAGTDGTFGNRWDDAEGVYRVLYASSSRLGALVEVLARFRPDLHVLAELSQIEGDEDLAIGPGDLDASWLSNRRIGTVRMRGEFVDVGLSESLAEIRNALAARVLHYGLDELDAATIRLSAPRKLTQEISRHLYDQSTPRRLAAVCGPDLPLEAR